MDGLAIHPVTPERWDDLERLFGPSGAYSNCGAPGGSSPARSGRGPPRPPAVRSSGAWSLKAPSPGLLAYLAGEPVGWCAVRARRHMPA